MTSSTTAEPAERDRPEIGHRDDDRQRGRLRVEHVVLAVFVLVGLVRGLFWVALTEVWNPVDESTHFAYVESVATGKGIPEVGRDLVSDEVLSVAKQSPTYYQFRMRPYRPTNQDEHWAGTRHQYEAVQGPVYYALMAPFYWLGRPFGFLAAVYAVRLGTLLLSLAAVPLIWMLGRQLFPRRRWVGLTAAGLLVVTNGFNANEASISNDSLAIVASAAAILVFLWALRGRPAQVLLAGVCFGVAVVNKTTALELAPLLGIALVATVLRQRWKPRALVTWALVFVAGSMAALVPWLAFNLATYHATTASAQVDAVLAGTLTSHPFSATELRSQFEESRRSFWELQLAKSVGSHYRAILELAAVLAAVGGIAASLARGRRGEAAWLAWLALAWPLAFVVMMAIVFGVLGGSGLTAQGRHYYPMLVPVVLLIAAGAHVVFGHRWAIPVVLALAATLATAERGMIVWYADAVYATGRIGNTVPVVEQSWSDGFVPATSVEVDSPCPTRDIALVLNGSPPGAAPPALVVTGLGSFAARPAGTVGGFSVYELPAPVGGRLAITFDAPTPVGVSTAERNGAAAIPGHPEDPMVRVYCPVADPLGERFATRYAPLHPGLLTAGRVRAWADAWATALWAGTVAVAVALVAGRRRRTQREGH